MARPAPRNAGADRWPANEQASPVPGAFPDGFDDDEPTADSWEWNWSEFANNVVHAAEIAVRNTAATEVVLVAPRPMLDLLRRQAGALIELGVELVEVALDPALLRLGGGGDLASLGEVSPREAAAGLRMIA